MVKRKNSTIKNIIGEREKGIDKVLIFRFFRLLHGRFWGFGAIISILIGAGIGYAIRPDLFHMSYALSMLGTDVRTAPFFSGSIFFAAYSLWRWRTYLKHTLKYSKAVISLLALTILGLYLIALMPVTWDVWPHRIHNIGVALTGVTMSLTVLADSILSRTRKGKKMLLWKIAKLFSFILIVTGGIITALSIKGIDRLDLILLGEAFMFSGYSNWIIMKIYIGESPQSTIGRIFNKIFY